MHEKLVGSNVLVTVDNWFYAPDGKMYRAVFGKLKAVSSNADTLGIKTNARSTNWYIQIGEIGTGGICIAGCQVHYVVAANDVNVGAVYSDHMRGENIPDGIRYFDRPSEIYNAGE